MATTTYPLDLYQYEVGTIFAYTTSQTWCVDGRAVIIESGGDRLLVDTYWSDRESALSHEKAATATVVFVPSEHREIQAHEARGYEYRGDKVTVITRQHGCYTRLYVAADAPLLTEADQYRVMLVQERERLAAHEAGVIASRASIARFESHLAHLLLSDAGQL